MAAASTWADEIRPSRPQTAPWHYVDIEIDRGVYDAARDCPNDDCVIAQIDRDRRIIADKSLLPAVRAEALRWLIHLVGDVHQPLHCGDNHDRGGNGIPIIFHGRRFNMHGLWDVEMVEQLGDDPAAIAAELNAAVTSQERQQKIWEFGTAVSWAIESVSWAKTDIYDRYSPGGIDVRVPIVIPDAYLAKEAPLVRMQLTRAGLRLAWLLNRAFKRR